VQDLAIVEAERTEETRGRNFVGIHTTLQRRARRHATINVVDFNDVARCQNMVDVSDVTTCQNRTSTQGFFVSVMWRTDGRTFFSESSFEMQVLNIKLRWSIREDYFSISVQPVAGDKKAGKRPTPSFLRPFLGFPLEPPLGFLGDRLTGSTEGSSFLEAVANAPQFLLKIIKFYTSNSSRECFFSPATGCTETAPICLLNSGTSTSYATT